MESRKRKIDNQSSTSAAKVVKEDVEKQNEQGLNPLFMTEILPAILNYLDVGSLKKSRLVCSFWGFEGGKVLLNKSNVKLVCFSTKTKTTGKKDRLEDFLNTKGTSSTFNSTVNSIKDPNSLKNVLPLLLQQTTSLSLNPSYSGVQGQKFVQFLEFFPNIQILHLQHYWEDDEDFSDETKKFLLNKFESLKEIRLKFYEWRSYNLIYLLLTKNELGVKKIHLQYNIISFFEDYLESGCSWPIETLVLDVSSLRPEFLNTIQPFLEKISGSLKHFGWNLTGPQNLSDEFLVPWANNLLNPAALNQLETFFIFCENWNSSLSDLSWLLFTFALQLPNLKKLTVDKVPQNLEDRIQTWNNYSAATGRTLRSESLEELYICQYWSDSKKVKVESFVVFSSRLWPNLKSLYIEYPPDNLPTCILLSEWIRLERLDLKFGTMSKKIVALWTKWLTGGEISKDGNASLNTDDANCALKDFKDLKHFGLWENWHSQRIRIASDFLVDNSLKFMTQLQSLYLENSNISPEVKKKLEETLGPNVNVKYQN